MPTNLRPCCRRRSRKCTPVCDQVRWNINEWNKFYVSKIITKLASLEMRALLFTKSPPGPRFLPKVFLPPPHLPLLRAQVIKLTQGLSQLFLDCKMKSSRNFVQSKGWLEDHQVHPRLQPGEKDCHCWPGERLWRWQWKLFWCSAHLAGRQGTLTVWLVLLACIDTRWWLSSYLVIHYMFQNCTHCLYQAPLCQLCPKGTFSEK